MEPLHGQHFGARPRERFGPAGERRVGLQEIDGRCQGRIERIVHLRDAHLVYIVRVREEPDS